MSRSRVMRRTAELAEAPPAEAAATSALARYRKGRRLTGEGRLPNTGEPFVWRLLSGAEEDEAAGAAVGRLNALGVPLELRSYAELNDALHWEILAIAMRDPDVQGSEAEPYPRPFASSSLELRELLTTTERDLLAQDYWDFADSVDPCPDTLPDEVALGIEALVKKKDAIALSSFGCRALAIYLTTTASPPATSPSGSSTSSSPSGQLG